MLKKGDKVRIVGYYLLNDFTEGLVVSNEHNGYVWVEVNNRIFYLDEYYVFKVGSFSLKVVKFIKKYF